MLSRFSPALVAFGGSLLLLGGLIAALYWTDDRDRASVSGEPVVVYCAEAMHVPMDAIAKDYHAETGQKVELHFGASQAILANLALTKKGDLFLPADESYVRLAKKDDLVADVTNVATLQAVVIVRPGYPSEIKTWSDFLAVGSKLGLANPEATAIGKLTKQHLQGIGLWAGVEACKPSFLGTVNEVGNSVANVGSSDAGIVWNAVAQQFANKAREKNRPAIQIVHLNELDGIKGQLQIALVKNSKQPDAAQRFVRFLRAKDKGAIHLAKNGYGNIVEGDAMDSRPELIVYAGAMLRPALEASLNDFEKREKVRITRVYNGCGILVSQMKAGTTPDLYFACDTSFMVQVKDQFGPSTNVSNNQLMITVKKGNPKDVHKLSDLGKPGLRVGVGHEHQCALGALTKETFVTSGVYAKVMKNVVVQSPTGDFLVNQLRTGALDVVVAYRSNILPYDELEGIPITGIPCATPSQPIAVSKSSTHPELSRRLMQYLQNHESRTRFEKSGFGWEVKEVEK